MKRFSFAIRWFLLVIVRPVLTCWIIVNGIPPSIRAIGSVVREVGKLIK